MHTPLRVQKGEALSVQANLISVGLFLVCLFLKHAKDR